MTTKIEWADMTINPVVGCTKCSDGCRSCYAERFAARMEKHPNPKISSKYAGVVDENGKWTGKINSNFSEKMYPHRVPGKRKKVFVGSMTDIFHPNYPADNRDEIFASILADHIFTNGHGHTFIILTKRPQAMAKYFAAGPDTLLRRWGRAGNGWIIVGDGDSETFEEYADGQTIPQEMTSPRDNLRQDYLWPLPNVWLGVTVCNQAEADAKIPVLLQTPAAVRFVSVEPMLEAVDLQAAYPHDWMHCKCCGWYGPDDGELGADHIINEDGSEPICPQCGNDGEAGEFDWTREVAAAYKETILPGLDWVICGGETGPGARPMHPDWVRGLRDQCQGARVPFFFKSWGEWVTENQSPEDIVLPGHSTIPHGWKGRKYEDSVYRVGKRRAGRLLDGVEHNEFPEVKA